MPNSMPHSETGFTETSSLLELASMFNGPFSLDWIVELTAMKASAILSILEEQVDASVLIRIKPAVYQFENKQRNQWLDRLTIEQKNRFHHHIASILIRELEDDENKPIKIAAHLLHVDVGWKECQWLMNAGEFGIKTFDAEIAIECFRHILNQLSHQFGEQEDLLFIKAAILHSNNYAGRTDLDIHMGFLLDARERAKKRNWQIYAIMLEMHIAKFERLSSKFNRGIQRFQQAFAAAESINDPELNSTATVFNSYFLFWQGHFQDAIMIFEKSLPDVQKNPLGFFPMLASIMVGHSYAMIGQITHSLGMLDNLRNYCLKSGDRYLLAHASSTIAMVMLCIDRLDDAYHYLKLATKEANASCNEWVKPLASIMMGVTLHRRGDSEKAIPYLRRFLKHAPKTKGNLLFFPYLLETCFAMATGQLRRLPGFSVTAEIDRMLKINNCFLRGLAYRYKALLESHQTRPDEKTIRRLALSAKWFQKSGNRIEQGKTHLALTRCYLTLGNQEKAKAVMAEAAEALIANEFNLIPDDLRPLIDSENHQEIILNEIISMADQLGALSDNSKLLQHIITTVNRITGAERGALLVFEEHNNDLVLRASKNITADQIADQTFTASKEIIQEVITTGRSKIYQAETSGRNTTSSADTIRSSICLPLVVKDRVIGALYHDNRLLGNAFKSIDDRLLHFFTALATLELDRENKEKRLKFFQQRKREDIFYKAPEGPAMEYTDGVIGESKAIKHLLAQVKHVANTDTAVLITGETGVGKNLIASVIHKYSSRHNNSFVTVQCSALTEGLITSELFGHEKGAFTGATNRHIGRFELADGGTLFLDEIGDLSLEVQARLLRVLQSKEFERVGGGKDVLTSDFRLIAATNKDLEAEVQANRFRKDLLFRINVFPLNIPPLRERKDDIPLLVAKMVETLNTKTNDVPMKIPKEAMKALIQYDWPGNIRELENVVQRGIINGDGRVFNMPPLATHAVSPSPSSAILSLEENERRHILSALDRAMGKVHGPGGAAEILNINPSTLASRIKKLGIKSERQKRTRL